MAENKYKNLISNTVIFAIGSFGSKLMVFLLVPLYTGALTTAEYGIATLIADTANMILPIITVSMYHGILRYGLDKATRKSDVFTVALTVNMIGFGVFIALYPILKYFVFVGRFSGIGDHILLLYFYVFASSMNSLCGCFVRAKGQVKLYAVDGIFNTFCLVTMNILFLLVFKWGIVGYVLSTIMADTFSVIFLFLTADLKRYLRFGHVRKGTYGKMIRFSLPMIPNSIFWWITNLSDRYMITGMIDASANGIYEAAAKLPNLINTIAGIFSQAWQMSAITEYDKNDRRFYAKVFSVYQTVVFLTGGVLLLLTKPIISVWLNEAYYSAWEYVPFLVLSIVFSCFAGYYSSIYMAMKKNVRSMLTTMLGAITNIILNFFLIPRLGIQGAAIATFASYLVVYMARAIEIRKLYRFRDSSMQVAINTVLLLAESLTLLYYKGNFYVLGTIIFGLLIVVNARQVIDIISQFGGAALRILKKRK
ncbi:MAG: polysaccharide biosynthesis C-terminal domain-containing protein [Clostridia bacterium]|nr:polysaccharide biosynthesis C-terminal domain-containing protein [Clostridia bacterium]